MTLAQLLLAVISSTSHLTDPRRQANRQRLTQIGICVEQFVCWLKECVEQNRTETLLVIGFCIYVTQTPNPNLNSGLVSGIAVIYARVMLWLFAECARETESTPVQSVGAWIKAQDSHISNAIDDMKAIVVLSVAFAGISVPMVFVVFFAFGNILWLLFVGVALFTPIRAITVGIHFGLRSGWTVGIQFVSKLKAAWALRGDNTMCSPYRFALDPPVVASKHLASDDSSLTRELCLRRSHARAATPMNRTGRMIDTGFLLVSEGVEAIMKRLFRWVVGWWLDFDPDDPESYPATGTPDFAEGDRVVVIDEDLREALGSVTGTIVEVNDQFGQWEYRVEMDGSDSWLLQRHPDLERGHWMTGEQLDRIVE